MHELRKYLELPNNGTFDFFFYESLAICNNFRKGQFYHFYFDSFCLLFEYSQSQLFHIFQGQTATDTDMFLGINYLRNLNFIITILFFKKRLSKRTRPVNFLVPVAYWRVLFFVKSSRDRGRNFIFFTYTIIHVIFFYYFK